MAPKVVTPYFLRVKPKKPSVEKIFPKQNSVIGNEQNLTKFSAMDPATTTPMVKTTINMKNMAKSEALTTVTTTSTTTIATTTSTTTSTSTTTPPPTTTLKFETTIKSHSSTKTKRPSTVQTFSNHANYPSIPSNKPQAHPASYASIPILDTQPWRPIHREELLPGSPPAFPTKTLYLTQRPPVTEPLFNLFVKSKNPIFNYNTFGNMTYQNIERLGTGARIKPHPLPVSLIDEVVPSFKPFHYKENNINPFSSMLEDVNSVHLTTTTDIADIEITTPEVIQQSKETTEQQKEKQPFEKFNVFESYEIAAKSSPNAQNITAIKEDDMIITTTMETTMPTTVTTTKKALFLNMKEIILKRNEAKNAINGNRTNTYTDPETKTTTMSSIKRNDTKHTMTLDDSYLFPSHSKWEFLNSSSANNQLGISSNLRKVFNDTLQAWVSEDIKENSENLELNEIKTRINNVTNLQDISIIFDTLASKLGVTQSIPMKMPPVSENRFKEVQKLDAHLNKQTQSSVSMQRDSIYKKLTTTTQSNLVKLPTVQWPEYSERPLLLAPELSDRPLPLSGELLNTSSSEGVGAAIPVFGEADVEEMDPTKYEELLRSTNFAETSSRETIPELVTLLPVRSNLGMRKQADVVTEVHDK